MEKKIGLIILFIVILSTNTSAQTRARRLANIDTDNWKYEIEAVKTGIQGSYLIKVWSYSNKPSVAIEQAKKNAVHGIIFRGFSGTQGVPGQKPLSNNPNLEFEMDDYFKEFFSETGGKYLKYVNSSTNGSIAPEDRLKIDKNTYKMGVIVNVNISLLRKELEAAGVIKSLNTGF